MEFGVTRSRALCALRSHDSKIHKTPKHCGITDIYAVPAFICRRASFSNGGSLLRLSFSSPRKCFHSFVQVGTSGIVPEEFPRRWESLERFGLLRYAGDSPFCLKPCVSAPARTNKVSLILYPAVCVFAA